MTLVLSCLFVKGPSESSLFLSNEFRQIFWPAHALPLCLRHATLLNTSACRYQQALCFWRDSIGHLINWLLGCSHEDTKSVIDGNNVVKRPISGTTPNVSN